MLGCHPIQSSGKLRFVGQYIQFENSDNAVRPAFRFGQVFEQHSFLHWRQGVDPLHLLVPGGKVLHHRAEFTLRPLGLAQIRRSILFFGQAGEIIRHIGHVPEEIPDKAFDLFLAVNPAVIGHVQPEPAAFHQRIEREVIAKAVSGRQRGPYGNIRRAEHTVTGRLFGIHFAEIVEAKAGNAVAGIGESFPAIEEAQYIIAHAFIRHAVQAFLDLRKGIGQTAADMPENDRINGSEPAHRPIRNERAANIFAAMSLQLHGQVLFAAHGCIAQANRRQQSVVDVGVHHGEVRTDKRLRRFFIQRSRYMQDFPAVILFVGNGHGQQLFLYFRPVGNLLRQLAAVAISLQRPGIVVVSVGLHGQLNRLALLNGRNRSFQIGGDNAPGHTVNDQMMRRNIEIAALAFADQGNVQQGLGHVHVGLQPAAQLRNLLLRMHFHFLQAQFGINGTNEQAVVFINRPQKVMLFGNSVNRPTEQVFVAGFTQNPQSRLTIVLRIGHIQILEVAHNGRIRHRALKRLRRNFGSFFLANDRRNSSNCLAIHNIRNLNPIAGLTNQTYHPDCLNGIAAQLEEIVQRADGSVGTENSGHAFRHGFFRLGFRLNVSIGTGQFRLRQCPFVHFAVGIQRQCVKTHVNFGHHIRRKGLGQMFFQCLHIDICFGHIVATQLPGGCALNIDRGLNNAGIRSHAIFYFAQLNTQTAQFDLIVNAPQILNVAVLAPTYQITAAISFDRLAVGQSPEFDELIRRQFRPVHVTSGHALSGNEQFAAGSPRYQIPRLVDDEQLIVGQRTTDEFSFKVTGYIVISGEQGTLGRSVHIYEAIVRRSYRRHFLAAGAEATERMVHLAD